ncbi:MAG: GNAT family protein [Patescibacteria group bacterium]
MKKQKIIKVFRFEGQNVIIRYPQASDLIGLKDLINALVADRAYLTVQKKVNLRQEKKWLSALLKNIAKKKVVHLLAISNGTIVGNCQVVSAGGPDRHYIGTFGIMIRKEYQNRGLGKKLLKIVIQEAKKILGVNMVILTVMSPNLRAQKVYRTCGFEEYGRLKRGLKHYGRYVDEIHLVKYLR